MSRRVTLPCLAVLAAASLIGGATTVSADGAPSPSASRAASVSAADAKRTVHPGAGPPYDYTTELMGEGVFVPLRDTGLLTRTALGYRFRTGGQDSHLTVTLVDGKLLFHDRGTESLRKVAASCERKRVDVGVAALCRVPQDISTRLPLLIEIWPRLGNDYSDTSTLPATFSVTVLGDVGRDVAHFGAGWDFFNGHLGNDQVWGGGGNDWLRPGADNDTFYGGPGDDDLVAMQGRDNVHGGPGDDRVGGAEGNDRLWGDAGADFVLCGTGRDVVMVDSADRIFHDCESLDRD